MKRIFLDANVLIDYSSRKASEEDAIWATGIVEHCTKRQISMLVSTHSVMVLSYFLTKELDDMQILRKIMRGITAKFEVITIEAADSMAATNSVMSDFEDAVQLNCAIKANAQLFVTKNISDFHSANLPITLPDQFFDFI